MLTVETVKPYNSKLFYVTDEHIQTGIKEFTELLKRAAYHQVKGYDNILEFEIDGVPESLEL